MKQIILTILLCFTGIIGSSQDRNPGHSSHKLLIEEVTVIPLHINKVYEDMDVIIQNGVIIDIRAHQKNDTSRYELGRINGRGKYLVPSYSDAHVHLPKKENLQSFFLMHLFNGVTTLRSMRGDLWHLEIEDSKWTPKLILSAPAITRRDSISEVDALKLFKSYKTKGFDFVKILSVKNSEVFENLVQASVANQLPLAGHCPRNIGIFNVCNSNVFQSIEHLGGFFQLTESKDINKAIDFSVSNNVYHCPTLDWYYTGQLKEDSLRKRKGVEFLPKELVLNWEKKYASYHSETSESERIESRKNSKEKFENRLKYLEHIYRQGGNLLLSQDASGVYSIPGFGIHTEMIHFSKAGISNFDILKSACYNLSKMMRTENEWGSIRIGSKSDMLLLDANPLNNISNSDKIRGVIFKGKYYDINTIGALLENTKK